MTSQELIKEIELQRDVLIAVATGGPAIQDVNSEYKERREKIKSELASRGIADPNVFSDLWGWLSKWKESLPSYQSRRQFIGELFDPLLEKIRNFNPDLPIAGGPMVQLYGLQSVGKQRTGFATREGDSMGLDPKRVFIVYGRNKKAYTAMVQFLRTLKLDPLEFDEVRNMIGGSPYVGEIVAEGMARAKAIIVMFTPDEFVSLHPELFSLHDTASDKSRWQSRPNVILEAGMALAIDESRTILVVLGDTGLASDLHGRHYIHLNNSASARENLKNALVGAGCPVSPMASNWHDSAMAGDFESCLPTPVQQGKDTSPASRIGIRDLAPTDTVVRTDWEQKYVLEDLGNGHLRVKVDLSFKVENFGTSTRDYWPELEIEESYNPTLISLVCHPADQEGYKYGGDKLEASPDRPGVKRVKGKKVEIKPQNENGDEGCKVYMTYSMMVPENYRDEISFGGPTIGVTLRAEFPREFQFMADPKRPASKIDRDYWRFDGLFLTEQHIPIRWSRLPNVERAE